MPPTVAARTDSDITDEAAGARRIQLAQESKARKEQEIADLRARNAQQAVRTASAGARTDVNIEDEAAGIARVELAAASKARRAEEARQMAQRNAELRARNKGTGVKTDVNIDDEEAGAARIKMAAESKARRTQDAQELARQNAQMRLRLRSMRTRTDTRSGKADISQQVEISEEERARRAQAEEEAAELLQVRTMLAKETPQERLKRLGKIGSSDGWNSSVYKPVPHSLRGLKPIYSAEPWCRDHLEKWCSSGMSPSQLYSTATFMKLDDGQRDTVAQQFRRKKNEENYAIMKATHASPWDPTPWVYVPPGLRGLRPVTNEPWARDADVNEGLGMMQDLDA